MKRYESYKDSGVKWLGEIPGHWEVTCLRRLLKRYSVKGHPNKPLLSVTREKGVILRGAKGDDGNNNIIPEDLSGYKHVKKGQFVINKMKSWQGSYGVSDFEGIVSPAYFVYDLDIADKRFFSWAIRSKNYVPFFMQYSKGIRVDQWDLTPENVKSIPFFIPPKSEQTAIANYLDSVTSKIDEAISQQQKMIDLLNERKQIIIQNAVTKGLDPNAKMKDSSVEWIGEIPENWEVRRIKNSCKLINKKSKEDLPYIELDNIESKSGKLLSYSNNRPDSICNHFEKGDILFCKLRPYLEKCIIAGGEGKCSSELLVLRHFLGNQKYFQYLLLSPKLIDLINESTYGAKMPRANWSYIGNCIIPIPSMVEQKRIINYLDSFTSHIDSSISQCNRMISLLQERKQIIINDVVTGKVNVI